VVKIRVIIQGKNYDIYPLGFDLSNAGKVISFTSGGYQSSIFAETLVNHNPVAANQLSSCFHCRDQIQDIQQQLEQSQITVVLPTEKEGTFSEKYGSVSLANFSSQVTNTAEPIKPPVSVYRCVESVERVEHKLVVEVAGRHLTGKQFLHINKTETAPHQSAYTQNDPQYPYRSLASFVGLSDSERMIGVAIAMGSGPSPMILPLLNDALPCHKQTDKKEWDNVIIPVKPFYYLSETGDKNNSALLRKGWLYVFWQGQLWRELEVKENTAMRDIRVEWYRKQIQFGCILPDEKREAEGHWLTNIWLPYKINNEYQLGKKGIRLAFSEEQWSWGQIKELESSTEVLNEKTISVDGIEQYSENQSFDCDESNIGTLQAALKSAGNSGVEKKIAALYIGREIFELNFLFELDQFDDADRDDLITLETADKSWQQTIALQTAHNQKDNWVLLEFTGVPKNAIFNMTQDPNDGEPAFYLFRDLSYENVILMSTSYAK
jgi:hypothetical protein